MTPDSVFDRIEPEKTIPEYWPKDKMPVSLDQILDSTRRGLPALRARRAAIERAARDCARARGFAEALRGSGREPPRLAVIAEVKRRSPSAGSIREDLDPADRAALYAKCGAAAVSVLTDTPYFGGSLDDLDAVASRVSVPLLRKDFILDELQIVEARAHGAAAVLLIVRALDAARLTALLQTAADVGVEALVEAHTASEVAVAVEAGATVIGINSRDLDSFRIDTSAAWRLIDSVPGDRVAVAESGMASLDDVRAAAAAGADAVLIGTALSASPSPERLLADIVGLPCRRR